ncbi:hypothetical protein NLB33_35300 [Mycolicibacterium smegmatis]|uniref:hypothetical protein n=1 Tax=Mycolicibacterium smegmatis TaxID=1772 RepID=UPI0020A47DB6|nr:hypothetical protein [Mycolicibacterium smegmatis]MCP2628119.1 hypothetical protein [Mycolicibacterium smegmatis]
MTTRTRTTAAALISAAVVVIGVPACAPQTSTIAAREPLPEWVVTVGGERVSGDEACYAAGGEVLTSNPPLCTVEITVREKGEVATVPDLPEGSPSDLETIDNDSGGAARCVDDPSNPHVCRLEGVGGEGK